MSRLPILLTLFLLPSCFLFRPYRQAAFSYTENGEQRTVLLVVPKRYGRVQTGLDSTGNEITTFHYGAARLYFARVRDTNAAMQTFDYGEHIAGDLFGARYYKRVDSSSRYWRENRLTGFRAGYLNAERGDDEKFDSSLNWFSLQVRGEVKSQKSKVKRP